MAKRKPKRKLTYTRKEIEETQNHWDWSQAWTTDYPANIAGIVYRITNILTDEKYIGCKHLRVKGWESYIGSSKYLKEAIEEYGKENFKFEVLQATRNRTQTIIAEEQWQLELNVVEDETYYNRHIGGRVWAGVHAHSEETKTKISASQQGNQHAKKDTIIGHNSKDVVIFTDYKDLEAAGFTYSKVSECITGKAKTHKGYRWTRASN